MGKLKQVLLTIINFPFRVFSKISPLTLIRDSKLSKNCAILSNTRFYNSRIDEYSYIGRNCSINNTDIGKFCSIADNCNIGLASHPITWVSTSPCFYDGKNILKTNFTDKKFNAIKKTIIGNDVWIGINVCIISGVRIGDGAIIGAGAIVTKDVEPFAIVGGNPAKLIKYRFTVDQIDALLKLRWWDESPERLVEAAEYVNNVNNFIDRLEKRKI